MPHELSRLANGIRIASFSMPHMESVSLGFWTAAGSRHETATEHGAAHFLEHLLFKGTSRRDSAALVREVERLGGSINAFTSEDHTCYYVKGPAAHLPVLADVLADMYRHPLLETREVDLEREVIKEEIAMVRDQPSQWLEDLLSEATWGAHPLGRPITGSEESLDRLDRTSLGAFHRRGYTGAQTVISAAGKLDHSSLVELLEPALGDLSPGETLPLEPAPMGAGTPRIETRDIEQTHLGVGFHAPSRQVPERYALKVLDAVLGENMSSLLFQRLREQEAVCYHVQSDVLTFDDCGLLHIYTGVDPDKLSRALEVIERTLRELCDSPLPDDLVSEAKDYLIGQSRISLENTSPQMMWAGESLLSYDRVFDPEESRAKIAAVTPSEIQDLAREILVPERLVFAAVTPDGTRATLENWLSRAMR